MIRPLLARARPSRFGGLIVTLALALAMLAPMALGPALGPLTLALGGKLDHKCACGMVQGTCGCPQCAAITHQRLREHAPAPYAVLRSQCEDDEVAPGFPGLPVALEAPATFVLLEPPASTLAPLRPGEARSLDAREPSTPPPRRLAA
jgi:hypothetical protein